MNARIISFRQIHAAGSGLALAGLTIVGLSLAGCARDKSELDETGGRAITRSVCPAVAVPAYTDTVTLFTVAGSRDSRAVDVTATITNLRTHCDDTSAVVHNATTFDVVAQRATAGSARDVILPYFATVMRGGTTIMSKQVAQVRLHFDDGKLLGRGTGAASADIAKTLATVPMRVSNQLNRRRKAGDVDASIDPMTDPRIRTAVNQANFELLIGFQLTDDQLAFNASR